MAGLRSLIVILAFAASAGAAACALVVGLEDKEPFPASTDDAAGDGSMISPADAEPDGGAQLAVETFASSQAKPWGVAVDEAFVYWTNEGDGTVVRAAKTGGAPLVLARGQAEPQRIFVDATNIVWHAANTLNRSDDGTGQEVGEILRIDKQTITGDGGILTKIDTSRETSKLRGMAFADVADNALWSTWNDQVRRYRRDSNGNQKDVVRDLQVQQPAAIAADNASVYWFLQQPSELWRIGKNFDQAGVDAGLGAIATLPGNPEVKDMVADGTALYMVTTGGTVFRVPTPAAGAGGGGGGAPLALATNQPFPRGIADDATHVYFTRTSGDDAVGQGAVVMVAKAGNDTRVLVRGLNKPRGIAVDVAADGSRTAYWANAGDGTIKRATLPR